MRAVTLACTQMACGPDAQENAARAEALVREAAARGAQVIVLQELFATPYFCQEEEPAHFALAAPRAGHPLLARFAGLAAELGVVLPVSYFERAGNTRFNSLAVMDADGRLAGHYRKSHIPQNPGYREKFYFSPGDTGFVVAPTRFGRIGCAVCWDQWFPETARVLALRGAEVLVFPTAIGSEPADPAADTMGHWRRAMQGHAAANLLPVVASNRIGAERQGASAITFYGSSFVADHTGALLAQMGREEAGAALATLDLDACAAAREGWLVFRDRRPDLYGDILRMDAS